MGQVANLPGNEPTRRLPVEVPSGGLATCLTAPAEAALRLTSGLAIVVALLGLAPSAEAQFKDADPGGAKATDSKVQRWKAGVVIRAAGGPCNRIVATAPIPIDWPEQTVKIVKEDITPTAKLEYRMVEGGVKQMVMTVPKLAAGEEAKAIITLEIRRSAVQPPSDTQRFRFADPKKLPAGVRPYLSTSPFIESTNPKIVAQAKQIAPDEEKAWARVEAIYDWVRENVQYENGPLRGALFALNEQRGDCEEMTSLFIALCRALGIPARTVHVPEHCYPEFYLVDEQGTGHWFPCQAAGSRAFGGIPETRPVLEKGDNFKDPRNPRERHHYLPENVTGTGSGGGPQVQFIRELLPE